MKQLRFFEIEQEDWNFLKNFREIEKELKELHEIYAWYIDFEKKCLHHLDEIKLDSKVINFEDIKAKQNLANSLQITQDQLGSLPEHIEDIRAWLHEAAKIVKSIN